MKFLLVSAGIIALLLIISQIYAMSIQNGIETYSFTIEKKYDKFEIRRYEASLFTSVKLSTNKYEEASSNGFRQLAGYIFGGNEKNQKIAMTSPVSMSLSDSMTMMFMVPKAIDKEDLPMPNQKGIKFTEEPEKRVAAISFGGWASSEKIQEEKFKLINYLKREGIEHNNSFSFLGYNSPFEMVGRKNEIIVELL
ncbi:MAG: heme-binding protein [Crocinitomicaceae bacterium]